MGSNSELASQQLKNSVSLAKEGTVYESEKVKGSKI